METGTNNLLKNMQDDSVLIRGKIYNKDSDQQALDALTSKERANLNLLLADPAESEEDQIVKQESTNENLLASYQVNDYIWEFLSRSHVRIKDVNGNIIYEKALSSSIILTDKSQTIVASDLVSIGLYAKKKDAKQLIQNLSICFLNDVPSEAEQPEEEPIELIDRELTLDEAWKTVQKIGIVPRQLLEIMMAISISVDLNFTVPIWLILIGNPSSFKTELIKLLRGIKDKIIYLSTMSENAFASGYIPPDGSKPKDLLPLLDGKIFLIRDLTTMFSLNEDTVKKILGDLTSIFDGEYEKFTATRGLVKYNVTFPFIACITPAILNKHSNYVNQLGSRFFFFRIPRLDDKEKIRGFEIAWSKEDRSANIKEATVCVSSYCSQIIKRIKDGHVAKIVDTNIQEWFNNAAEFVARARGTAITKAEKFHDKDNDKEVLYYDVIDVQIEEPWRAINQLRNLAVALATLRKKETVTIEECNTLKDIVRSTAPVDRAEVLNALIGKAGLTAKEVSEIIEKSSKTAQRQLKELEALGLVHKYKDPKFEATKVPWSYSIDPRFGSLLDADNSNSLPTPEFVSTPLNNDIPF